MVIARRLRRKITVQNVAESKDSYGQPIETWSTYAIRYADVLPSSGREYVTAQQRYAEEITLLRLRYDSTTKNISPKMRVKYGDRFLNIESALNDNDRNKSIQLLCREAVDG